MPPNLPYQIPASETEGESGDAAWGRMEQNESSWLRTVGEAALISANLVVALLIFLWIGGSEGSRLSDDVTTVITILGFVTMGGYTVATAVWLASS